MNLYVYDERVITDLLFSLGADLGMNVKEGVFDGLNVSYKWSKLQYSDVHQLGIHYPSGSLWNRYMFELIYPQMFPCIKPVEADYFLVPLAIMQGKVDVPIEDMNRFYAKVIAKLCGKLPYWRYNKGRHVFFVIGDYHGPCSALKDSIVYRVSCHKSGKDYPMYYNVLLDRSSIKPITQCENICGFVGCLETHPIRKYLVMLDFKGKIAFDSTPNFFYNLPENTQERMRRRWIDVLNSSKFILAPRGCGLSSIRFFEALSFGRIPILIADETKLPLESKIDYDRFIIRVPEKEMMKIPNLVEEFIKKNDLEAVSKLARDIWEENFSDCKLRNYLEASLPKVSNTTRLMMV